MSSLPQVPGGLSWERQADPDSYLVRWQKEPIGRVRRAASGGWLWRTLDGRGAAEAAASVPLAARELLGAVDDSVSLGTTALTELERYEIHTPQGIVTLPLRTSQAAGKACCVCGLRESPLVIAGHIPGHGVAVIHPFCADLLPAPGA
ncbi:MAG: hypothetical protein ACJ73S_18905 [Mycobacteriales bacterium]